MIILDVEQGSPEWFSARVGIPTASCFDKIFTTKLEPSKQAQAYMHQLAAESLIGASEDGYTNANMERGKELEGEARAWYEFYSGKTFSQVGLVYHDERKLYSCSPDGLGDCGLEIKCPKPSTHVRYLLANKLPTEYWQQVHGSMAITGKSWVFVSYCPGLPALIVPVRRDEETSTKIISHLEDFCEKLGMMKELLRAM